MSSRDTTGRPACQVEGCSEPAFSWTVGIPIGELIVEAHLCRRHEAEIRGAGPEEP